MRADAHRRASAQSCPVDASNEGSCLGSLRAYADGVGFVLESLVANIYIVIARGEIHASASANGDVVIAGGVGRERINTIGCVVEALGVGVERNKPSGRVVEAGLC